MKYTEKVTRHEWLSYNVVILNVAKPAGFEYNVGDAVEIKVGDQDPGPFTMTNLPTRDELEFVIRIYEDHHGKTEAISKLKVGDEISFTDPFNTFQPKEGALFLAGGTGITPFIAVMRAMRLKGTLEECLLIFYNKSRKDLFLADELTNLMGDNYLNVITEDQEDPEYYGNIDEAYLESHIDDLSRPVLVCGPPSFSEAMEQALKKLGATHVDLGS